MRVFIVAPSPAGRERLRREVESDQVRVVGDAATLAGAADTDAGLADVLLVADEQAVAAWPLDLEPPARAIVVLAGFEVARVAARLSSLDLLGWSVLGSGASGDEVRAAIAAADAGMASMPVETASSALLLDEGTGVASTGAARGSSPGDADGDLVLDEPLTPREREVLEELAHGLSNRDIAVRLHISEHTAKFHVASILAKLGAANRADAVRRGLRRGLVTL